ncbi:anthranilate phosphoribosyltransferase [Halomicrococcus sp. SG-WS-1]|uniref:anthranilate phosphoribosyltransferase n=1 Tax=Halomicrococcus sp. SG-WS-1 TaxID=3439057 RepID=UPI003F79AF94
MTGEWPLKRLLTEAVGSGPRSADDMSYDQAREAFERILAGDPAPETLGAFWMANRWKRNTPTELAGFVDAMRERSVDVARPDADPVDCGANYDGKSDTALLGVASGLVAAAAGTPVVVHSADRVPASEGVAYRHVLDELGVETDLAPAASAAMVDEVGFGFYPQSRANPGVDALLPARRNLGVRSFVNTVETLANPADADAHLGSFFHLSFAKKLVGALRESDQSVDRVVAFQGLEGYDDVRPGTTRFADWDGEFRDDEIETATLGLDGDTAALEVTDVRADSARITEAVLSGERDGAFADAVAVNAAFRMYARSDVETLTDGVELARKVLADGDAADRLAALRAFDPGERVPERAD